MPISPSSLSGYDFNSEAEKKIYLAAQISGHFNNLNRYLFHSLIIHKTGNKKLKGEIDFVYLDKDCILFLEVKGGQVKYDSLKNDWYVMGGTQKGDPFKQAYDSLYQTRDNLLVELFGNHSVSNRLVFGIGVLFPDCIKPVEFQKHGISNMEYDSALIYDFNDSNLPDGLIRYIEKIKNYWSKHNQFKEREGLSEREVVTISKFFRQDRHFKLPISELIKKSSLEVTTFTRMQMYALDSLHYNPGKGGLIIGGPGTGKTVLALELLRRLVNEGKRTLFICFNRNLLESLKLRISNLCIGNNYEIRHLHGLLRDSSYIDGPLNSINKNEDYWSKSLPLYFSKNLNEENIESFDHLIIDEGQDILNEYYIEALGKLIKGGLNGGSWTVFLDKTFQNIYNPVADEYFDYLRCTYPAFIIPLQLNCRNTLSTIKTAVMQTGLPLMPCLRNEYIWNSLIRFHNSDADLKDQIFDAIEKLESEGIDKKYITILCSEKKQISDLLLVGKEILIESAFSVINKINVCTIHSYKGLENEFILIIGPSYYDPCNVIQMHLIYIANTRACSQSVLFLDRKFKNIIEDRNDQNI